MRNPLLGNEVGIGFLGLQGLDVCLAWSCLCWGGGSREDYSHFCSTDKQATVKTLAECTTSH